ncbi:MAG TPA: GAF domain-containing protein, partial [Gemmatimonadales bacterium]|nr:GAF domain-containing protein [Gemmatimonadales bacterium]
MTDPLTDESRRILVQPPALLPPPGPSDAPDVQEASPPARPPHSEASEARKLGTLVDVSQALAGHVNLHAGLSGVLLILARRSGAVRGAVALVDERTGELVIRAGMGLGREGQTTSHRLGEGVTGGVVATGEPAVVPKISADPRFLDRAAGRQEGRGSELSFVCVPILLHRRPVGTLSIELPHKPDRQYDRLLKFLKVVASMISQAVRIHRLLEAERQKLVSENAQLRQELKQRYDFSNMVGASGPMHQLYEEMARVADTATTVLVRGESGTGKELIAHAIHHH